MVLVFDGNQPIPVELFFGLFFLVVTIRVKGPKKSPKPNTQSFDPLLLEPFRVGDVGPPTCQKELCTDWGTIGECMFFTMWLYMLICQK